MSQEIEKQEEEVFNEEGGDDTQLPPEGDDNLKSELEAKDKKIKELEALIARKKRENKVEHAEKSEAPKSDLSQKDLYALMANKVHEEDIDEVVEYAKLKGLPVAEALKSSVVKTILKEKEEIRNTAAVTNTGVTRKSATPKDADTLVNKARKGEVPQTREDMIKVFNRMKGLDRLD